MENIVVNKLAASGIIERIVNGTHFQVVFTKKDGSERVLSTIKGLAPDLNGKGKRYSDQEKGFISLYDVAIREWRVCNLNTLSEIRFEDVLVEVV